MLRRWESTAGNLVLVLTIFIFPTFIRPSFPPSLVASLGTTLVEPFKIFHAHRFSGINKNALFSFQLNVKMPTIIHIINKYCTTHSYPIYIYYLTSYIDQGENVSMTFINTKDLFQRKLIN